MKNIDLFFYENLNSTTGVNDYREKHNKGNFVLDYRVSIAVRNFNFSLIINNFLNTEYSLRPVTIEAPRMSQLQVIYKIN
jgi:hypothetical protein